ncbi:LysR family transcriptional regulator [Arenimonas aestuarii]
MRVFVETVRANGFAAAARKLDIPRSKVSKLIQSLEESLGVQLLMRTTRSIRLTEAGAAYFESVQDVLSALDEAEDRARVNSAGLRGSVRCNVPISFGLRVLTPLIPEFHAENPDVELQLSLTDQIVDPVSGGFDLTIRIGELKDSSLVARQMMPAPRCLVASPAFVAKHGVPREPRSLAELPFLNYGCLQGGITLSFSRQAQVQRVRTRGPIMADNGDFLAMMAEAGLGAALLPEFIVRESLTSGALVALLEDWHAPPVAVHALFPPSRNMPLRVRRFVDFLMESLQPRMGRKRS